MKRKSMNRCLFSASLASLVGASTSMAVPVTSSYVEDARCDAIPSQTLTHELGDAAIFPLNESIIYSTSAANTTVCVPDDLITNDWIVQMTNTSGVAWQNLFFVCDKNTQVGNADGNMFDVINAPLGPTDAFRIDGTVTLGLNNNLLGESGVVDEIFSPGETWRFNVSNFMALNTAGVFTPPVFVTPGIFAGSSTFNVNPGNASILATPVVPEPATVGIIVLGLGGLLLRRPGRA